MRRRQALAAKQIDKSAYIVGSNNFEASPKSHAMFYDVLQEKPSPEIKPAAAKKSRKKK